MYDFVNKDFPFKGEAFFKVRGVYVNTVFDQPPLCATYWPFYRWKEFIDLLVELKLNRFDIFLWPRARAWDGSYNMVYSKDETTQIPRTLEQVKLFKKVLAYAKKSGLSTAVGFSMNAVTPGISQKNPRLHAEPHGDNIVRIKDAAGKEQSIPPSSIGGEGCLLCWNKPGAKEMALDIAKEQIQEYKADEYYLCPIDLGGCWCKKCRQDYSAVILEGE